MDIDNTPSNEDAYYRLPTNVKPTHYDLTIRTDLKALTFQGYVKISLDVVVNTSKIVLNSSQIVLGQAYVYSYALKTEQSAVFESYDQTQQRTTYTLKETLPAASKAELKIPFRSESTLADTTRGYFKSSWEHDGQKEYYSLTQLSPTAARRVFPCWDEPALKATFAVSLISRADTVNISNMSVVSEEAITEDTSAFPDLAELRQVAVTAEPDEKWKITKFRATPPMSTYIVAFANGRFEFLETSVVSPLSGRTIPLRVYATPDIIHQARYALDVKAAVLPSYEKVFNVEYPLPKLDTFIAHNFEGAMENWGLIMATASTYLLDPNRADEVGKRVLASVQSHETAHMWFGNIATMAWWNYVYLNEGFATLMGEVIIIDKVFPEWKATSEFIANHLDKALALDAKISSHPVEIDCSDVNNVNQTFDVLSYSKAASVLRMLSAHVSEDQFLQGVSLYLKKHLFASTITTDLWEGISAATGFDVAQMMGNWITKTGYPVLSITENATGIHIRQDQFLETGIAGPEYNETLWHVPLGLLSMQDGHPSVNNSIVLRERETSIELDMEKPFKLNAETTGFYRVLYIPERLEKIAIEAAKDNSIFSLNDKIGLLQDAFTLSKAGLSSLGSCLTLVKLWKHENEYLVWKVISNGLGELASIWWENTKITDGLNRFRRSLFVPLTKKLGYEKDSKESADTGLLRTLAVGQALAAGDEGVIQEFRSRFEHYLETGDDSKIPVDLQRSIFIAAVKYGGLKEYEAMIKIIDNPKTALERTAAIGGMTSPQDPSLLERTTTYITEKARHHDMVPFIASMSSNFKARRLLTTYFEDNYEVLYKRLEDNFALGYLIKYCFEFYSAQKDYKEIEEYFKNKDTSKYSQSLAQALDNIHARITYVERSTEELITWLDRDRE